MGGLVTHYSLIMWMLMKILHVSNPRTPQYKKRKNREFTSLILQIMDQKNNIIADGLQVTAVLLYIRDYKS